MKEYICQYCGKSTYDVDIDYLVGYNQVIGHTHLAEKTIKNYNDITLTFIDTGNENAYHLIN